MANKIITINGVNFERVSNAKAEEFLNAYLYARNKDYHSLWKVYKSFSKEKEDAFNDCIEIMNKVHGSCAYITSSCIFTFTLSYVLKLNGSYYLVRETPAHRYIANIDKWDYFMK